MADPAQSAMKDLLEVVSEQEAIKLKVLHNGVIQAMRAYKDDSTSAKLKDWKASEKELAEEVERLEKKYAARQGNGATWGDFQETTNKAEVLRWLLSMGYDVSARTFYRHCKEGKCKTGTKGVYSRRVVKDYADSTLPLAGTDETVNDSESSAMVDRLKEQAARERINRKRDEIKLQRESGEVLDRGSLNLEQAARAVALDTGFRQMVNAEGIGWIVAVGGDTAKLAELVDMMLLGWDELINTYATASEFEVVFDKESYQSSVISHQLSVGSIKFPAFGR